MATILPDGAPRTAAEKALEERVAALEAELERVRYPWRIAELPAISDEEAARFKKEFEAAAKDFRHHEMRVVPSLLTVFDPGQVRAWLRECVTVVKPGEALFIRLLPGWAPEQVSVYQRRLNEILKSFDVPVRAFVIVGEELGVAEAPDEPPVT